MMSTSQNKPKHIEDKKQAQKTQPRGSVSSTISKGEKLDSNELMH